MPVGQHSNPCIEIKSFVIICLQITAAWLIEFNRIPLSSDSSNPIKTKQCLFNVDWAWRDLMIIESVLDPKKKGAISQLLFIIWLEYRKGVTRKPSRRCGTRASRWTSVRIGKSSTTRRCVISDWSSSNRPRRNVKKRPSWAGRSAPTSFSQSASSDRTRSMRLWKCSVWRYGAPFPALLPPLP